LGCNAMQSRRSLPMFQRSLLPPSSGWSPLLMEAERTSETLVNFYQTTWCYNPEDSHLCTHCHENLMLVTSNNNLTVEINRRLLTAIRYYHGMQKHLWSRFLNKKKN
jgi:hypothetical protein